MSAYRRRVFDLLKKQLATANLPAEFSALDFGAGDGWFASQVSASFPKAHVRAIDVQERRRVHFGVEIVGPNELTNIAEKSVDLVYAVDVLHHCHDPKQALSDMIRVSKRYLLIKDHVAFSSLDYITLGILDELGNRRFGIPSNYKYQRNWEWDLILKNIGWTPISKICPAPCHMGVLGALTNRLQYVAIYRSPDSVH